MIDKRADSGLPLRERPGDLQPATSQEQQWAQLFLRARQGQPELFGALSEQVTPWLLRRLWFNGDTRALCQIPDDCQEVLQESFLKAWASRDTFHDRGCLSAWLWTITHNTAVSLLRKRRKRTVSLQMLGADGLPDRLRADTDPIETLAVRELQERLQAALAAVTNPLARKALELRFVEGKPYEDIAREVGVPLGTVATWVSRLRQGLRRCA